MKKQRASVIKPKIRHCCHSPTDWLVLYKEKTATRDNTYAINAFWRCKKDCLHQVCLLKKTKQYLNPNPHNAERQKSEINQRCQSIVNVKCQDECVHMWVFLYERHYRAVVTLAAISGKGDSSSLTLTTTENKSLMQLESSESTYIHHDLIWIKIFIKTYSIWLLTTTWHSVQYTLYVFHSFSPVVYKKNSTHAQIPHQNSCLQDTFFCHSNSEYALTSGTLQIDTWSQPPLEDNFCQNYVKFITFYTKVNNHQKMSIDMFKMFVLKE